MRSGEGKYKLLALDVDGTLLRDGHSKVTAKVRDAVCAAAKIIRVSFCTGRSHNEMLEILSQLKLSPSYHLLGGGATLLTEDGEPEEIGGLSAEDVSLVEEQGRKLGLKPCYLVGASWRDTLPSHASQVSSIFMAAESPDVALQIAGGLRALRERLNISVATVSELPGKGLLHFGGKLVNKGSALRRLREMLGIAKSEVISVGDMTNDLPMFQESGFSIAMGNAPYEVRRQASAVTRTVDEDGLAVAIEEYVL